MKKSSIKTLRRLLCFGLILTLMLSPAFSVFAADEISEEQNNEGGQVNELSTQEAPPAQLSASPEPAEPKSPEPVSEEPAKPAVEETQEAASAEPAKPAVEETPEVASKESVEAASEEPAEPAIEETPEAASQQSSDSVNDTELLLKIPQQQSNLPLKSLQESHQHLWLLRLLWIKAQKVLRKAHLPDRSILVIRNSALKLMSHLTGLRAKAGKT